MKILELLQFEFSYTLSMAIIFSLWQSLLIMFVISGMNRLSFFNNSRKKYTLNVIGLVTIFFLFLINIGIAIYNPSSLSELGVSGAEIALTNLNEYISESTSISITVYEIIAAGWIIGVVFFLSKFLLGNIYLKRIKNSGSFIQDKYDSLIKNLSEKIGLSQNVSLIQSNKINIPLIMGYLKPVILFPASYFSQLTPAQFESILIHELVHIKRNDYLINQIQSIIECIMFFNPFTWILSNQIRKYREYYCDDMVQSHIQDKGIYLNALYKVARYSGMTDRTSVALFNKKSELLMRVKRMLNQKTEDYTYRPFFGIVLFAILFFGINLINDDSDSESDKNLIIQVEDLLNKNIEIPMAQITTMASSNIFEEDDEAISEALIPIQQKAFMKLTPLNIDISEPIYQVSELPEISLLSLDTVPDSKKIKELERRLEEKSKEMEELGARFEKEYSENTEINTERIEELAKQLEERIEARTEELSERFESPEMEQKIEELARQLEEKIEAQMPKLEELNSEEMEAFERKVEKLAEEMEQYIDEDGNITNEAKVDELKKQIQEESKKFGNVMAEYEIRHQEIFENGEIKELQEQIQAMAHEMAEMQPKYEEMLDPISKELQAEIEVLQKQLQANLKPIEEELQQLMHEMAKEISEIARELEKERRKTNNE